MDCHLRCSHLGVGLTLTELRRSEYWVLKGRQAVKKAMASCALCSKFNARSVLPPNVASLPIPCIEFEVPFQNIGVDLGHLWVKEGITEKKKRCIYCSSPA